LLQALLIAVQALLAILQQLNQKAQRFTLEPTPYIVHDMVIGMRDDIESPFFGLDAIRTKIDALTTAVAAIPTSTGPVTLPTTPPAGYGSTDVVDLANAVWQFAQPMLPSTPQDALRQIARTLNTTASFDIPYNQGVFSVASISYAGEGFYIESVSNPTFDPTDLDPSETFLECLTRQNPTWDCSYSWAPQTYVSLRPTDGSSVSYITLIDESGYRSMLANLGIGSTFADLSLWPGLASVVLGTPVDLAVGVTVTGPMDGVIISITSAPTKQGYFTFDTMRSWRNVGALAFVTDDGQAEMPQTLGFESAVYVPKSMTSADTCLVRTSADIVGTVTPWTKVVA
jgi:hypothetical protein